MKTTFRIATQAYEFIEMEGNESDIPKMLELQRKYSDKPFKNTDSGFVKVKSFTGETILWNEVDHVYKSLDGVVLMGGSTYAKRFEKQFDAKSIGKFCSKAWGVPADILCEIWDLNSESSTLLGSALHNALEAVHKHWEAGEVVRQMKKPEFDDDGKEIPNENYALPRQPIIRKAVLAYIDQFGIKGKPEVLVTDVKNGMAGKIDSLHIIDPIKKTFICEDYKSSVMDKDKEKIYQHQQSFYAQILENHGWKCLGLYLTPYDGDVWTRIEQEKLEVTL
jgi:hypothetical protein